MVGMRDVARKAGVSLSTVSLVVNNTGYVSADMRAKVEAAMASLNYVPNELARNLYHDRTGIIGVIVPTISHPFFATLTAALQREFARHGFRVMLCSTADCDTGEAEYVDMLRRHMMDGIVMAAHTAHDTDYWTSIDRPVVAFDRRLGSGIPCVYSDHVAGGKLIGKLLLDTGASHVVLVGGPRAQFDDQSDDSDSAGERTTFPTVRYYLTVERMLAEAGVRCDYLEAGNVYELGAFQTAAQAVLQRWPDADAVVGSDVLAAFMVQQALCQGIDVPSDLQVIAYDGTLFAQAAGKRLTCVRQDFDGIAAVVAQCMNDAIAGRLHSRSSDQIVPVTLVPAGSTR